MLLDAYPYLIFDGEAQEAFDFYAEVLNAENLGLTKFKDMPAVPDSQPLSDEAQNLVMNATLQLPNGSYLMFSDTFPGMPYSKGNNVSITLVYDTLEETKATFDKLAEGGEIQMELQETFWSPLYGNLTDKFGVEWQLSTEEEETPSIDIQE
ncbi:MAG TPA: VOC family protein [Candidatus Jeotgalibaca pullicola]|nr:VOC family protein [Candidatus Jeotgalibaca pullicola]